MQAINSRVAFCVTEHQTFYCFLLLHSTVIERFVYVVRFPLIRRISELSVRSSAEISIINLLYAEKLTAIFHNAGEIFGGFYAAFIISLVTPREE